MYRRLHVTNPNLKNLLGKEENCSIILAFIKRYWKISRNIKCIIALCCYHSCAFQDLLLIVMEHCVSHYF